MSGVSGCFGGPRQDEGAAISNVEDVSQAVEGILEDTGSDSSGNDAFVLMQYCSFVERRVRMLTWAVVALAVVVVLREM